MKRIFLGAAALCLSLAATPLQAQTASSSAYGLGADQTVAGGVTVTVGPVAAASGSAPPAYSNTSTVASVNQSSTLVSTPLTFQQALNTGILTSTATSPFTPTLTADATATVNGLSTSLTSGLANINLVTLLGLSARTVNSHSTASGVGPLSVTGSTTIEDLTINGAFPGLTFNFSGLFNPAANTVLFNSAGLLILLNEQIASGDAITNIGIQTNAIRVGFTNFALGSDILNGNIIIAHSQAAIGLPGAGVVPEPASWALMIAGFGMAGGAMRYRRRAVRNA